MRRLAVLIMLACSPLSACATPEEIAAREEQEAREAEARTAAETAADDAYCQSISAQPGTDAYVNCRLVQKSNRDQRAAILEAQAIADQQAYQRQIQATLNPPTVNCTSTTTFGTTETTCR